jgi:hypothetical protein
MKFNQNHFTAALGVASVVLTAAVIGSGSELTVGELLSTKLVNAVTPLGMCMGFLYFLRGTQYDVLKDIFEEHNMAAAVFVASVFWIISRPFQG